MQTFLPIFCLILAVFSGCFAVAMVEGALAAFGKSRAGIPLAENEPGPVLSAVLAALAILNTWGLIYFAAWTLGASSL